MTSPRQTSGKAKIWSTDFSFTKLFLTDIVELEQDIKVRYRSLLVKLNKLEFKTQGTVFVNVQSYPPIGTASEKDIDILIIEINTYKSIKSGKESYVQFLSN